MRERPILFSGPMVRAILEGRKTMTRRVVKAPEWFEGHTITATNQVNGETRYHAVICDIVGGEQMFCPYGEPGDRLWVRETFGYPEQNEDNGVVYRATDPTWDEATTKYCKTMLWKPSIFMPRRASRITLEITGVRVERLQAITEEDAQAEGAERPVLSAQQLDGYLVHPMTGEYRDGFRALWDKINGSREGCCWDSNPWVWVVMFRRVEK